MSTATLSGTGSLEHREVRRIPVRVGSFGIGSVGVLAVLAAAWGGIVPFVGPTFGYSADGSGSWHWSMAHFWLGFLPGVAGVLIGATIVAETRGITAHRGRISLAAAGLVLMASGAWFMIGPMAWPVLTTHTGYFVAASPLRSLANSLGYSLGVGAILLGCGGFVAGWASRHQSKTAVPPVHAPTPPPV